VNVFFAGGGTGGHLYPALAIARAMVAADARVEPFFIGARRGIEREVLPGTEFRFELLDLHPLYRTQPWLNWRTAAGSLASWRRIAQLVNEKKPRALVATGGYAAGIALAHAAAQRLPIVIQEQNSFPGLTVRWFASRASQLHLGFPEAAGILRPGRRTQVFNSGNPIAPPPPLPDRPSHAQATALWGFEGPTRPTILIFGGSQGAEGINRVVAQWAPSAASDLSVIWATGRANYVKYASLATPSLRIVPFISPMSDAYAATDLAVTRAGAMTTAELSAWGIPAILIPLPTAAADHQTANARALSESGAAIMIQQTALTPGLLGATVHRLVNDPAILNEMREKTLMRARPDAAQDIASKILGMDCFK
jgi:UDP-N-acetylglucosamine--N-acetylmuramyl-(pentapeptide) pyrophosphoryl-undecaprenol N-acetylglucosamine transferase